MLMLSAMEGGNGDEEERSSRGGMRKKRYVLVFRMQITDLVGMSAFQVKSEYKLTRVCVRVPAGSGLYLAIPANLLVGFRVRTK